MNASVTVTDLDGEDEDDDDEDDDEGDEVDDSEVGLSYLQKSGLEVLTALSLSLSLCLSLSLSLVLIINFYVNQYGALKLYAPVNSVWK